MNKSELVLEARDIRIAYGKTIVVDKVNLVVRKSCITALVGANGAGKSSILKAIMGLVAPASGEIWYEGSNVTNWEVNQAVRNGVSLVPEGRRLFGDLTVAENLRAGAYIHGRGPVRERQFDTVLGYFPVLRERLRSQARQLSGGQQQMLAVARALMNRPRVLMLDEPTIGLAPVIVDSIVTIINDIAREGVEILLIEQNAQIALELAGYGYVLERGEVVMEGLGPDLLKDAKIRAAYLGI